MTSSYPATLDTLAINKTNATVMSTDHPAHHNDSADAINKIEAKVGTGASTPAANTLLAATATGVSGWTGSPTFDGQMTGGFTSGPVYRAIIYGVSTGSSFQGTKFRGTSAAPRRAQSGDLLARFSGSGGIAADDVTDATVGGTAARVEAYATENYTATAQGSDLSFTTIATGGTTGTERMRISSSAITFTDGGNFVMGTTSGTKIGTATTQKLGFWNATPIAQPAVYTMTGATADRSYTKQTYAPTNTTSDTAFDANSTSIDELADVLGTLCTKFNELQDVLMTFIADVKSTGLVG